MDSLEIRLARDVSNEYYSNAPFEQFQQSYFMYKRCVNQLHVLDQPVDLSLEVEMNKLYYKRLSDETRFGGSRR